LTDALHPLITQISARVAQHGRTLVGIAGPPGAGKSSIAERLYQRLCEQPLRCSVMPMDGFHFDNSVLDTMQARARKGAPHTFDAAGFCHTLARIHLGSDDVYVPVFDRHRDLAIAGAQRVAKEDDVVIVEGNYLFIQQPPWQTAASNFDIKVFINPGLDVIEARILSRWRDAQLDETIVTERTYKNDLPNANYVLAHSDQSNAVLLSGF